MKTTIKWIIGVLCVVVLVGAGLFLWQKSGSGISFEETKIDNTPIQIMEIKSIAEWEFLSVDCEVMVDTVRVRGFWTTDDKLVRIYRGCLRLGVNLKNADENWINVTDSAVNVNLPKIQLLDERFVDEANTVSFFESGKWDGQAKEQLLAKAEIKMRKYALTPEMFDRARQQAESRFKALLSALGYSNVQVTIAE